YFADLPHTPEVRSGWVLADATEHFFPRTSLARDTLAQAEALIADGDLHLSIRRRLVDEADNLGRKLAVLGAYPHPWRRAIPAPRSGPGCRSWAPTANVATTTGWPPRSRWRSGWRGPGRRRAGSGSRCAPPATTSSSRRGGWCTRGWSPLPRTRSPTA